MDDATIQALNRRWGWISPLCPVYQVGDWMLRETLSILRVEPSSEHTYLSRLGLTVLVSSVTMIVTG